MIKPASRHVLISLYPGNQVSELIITVGHRPFPVHVAHAAGQFHFLPDKMAERKRSACSSASSMSVGN